MARYRLRVFYTDETGAEDTVIRILAADNIEAAIDRVLWEVHPFVNAHWKKIEAVLYPNHFNGGSIVTVRERNHER